MSKYILPVLIVLLLAYSVIKKNNSYNSFDGNLIYLAYDIDTNILFIYNYN
jgi:hypothetical protein